MERQSGVIVTSGSGSTTSSAATLTLKPGPTDSYAQAVLADKPIGWWRLDETAAVTAEDIAGGNNGDYFNEPLTGADGIPGFATGKAVAFDGAGSQKIDIPWTPVLNGATKQFYLNGLLAGTATSDLSLNMARPLRIGGGATEGDGAFFFNGTVDEVAYYDTVLTAGRVSAHYAAGLGGGTAEPPVFTVVRSIGNNVTVTWDKGVLETSPDLQTWTAPNGAVSPFTEAVSGRKYYRIRY